MLPRGQRSELWQKDQPCPRVAGLNEKVWSFENQGKEGDLGY